MPIAVRKTVAPSSRARRAPEHGVKALLGPEYVEFELKTIIADVLQMSLDELDGTQSFLKLGGDSILAIKIMARCRAKGITLNVADMIDARGIAELCQRVSQSAPGVFLNGNDAYITTAKENNSSASQGQSKTAKSSEFMKHKNGQDTTSTPISYKTAHQQATSTEGQAVIDNALASTLFDHLPSCGTQSEPLDVIHFALVTAASITTSSDIEDILFYDVCGVGLQDQADVHREPYTASRFRVRLSTSEDGTRVLRRMRDCTHSDMYFSDEGISQQEPYVLTPASNSDNNIIIVDVRQLRHRQDEIERPVGPISMDFLSGAELNLDDSLHLSISFRAIGDEISCLFSGKNQWETHYDLDDFINVFIASIKGTLR